MGRRAAPPLAKLNDPEADHENRETDNDQEWLYPAQSFERHGSGGGGKALTPNQMKELLDKLDPDKCPSCGLEKIPGTQDWRINDPAAFEKSAIGSKVKGLSAGAVKMPKTGPAVGK